VFGFAALARNSSLHHMEEGKAFSLSLREERMEFYVPKTWTCPIQNAGKQVLSLMLGHGLSGSQVLSWAKIDVGPNGMSPQNVVSYLGDGDRIKIQGQSQQNIRDLISVNKPSMTICVYNNPSCARD
jgi:hypothetical protein